MPLAACWRFAGYLLRAGTDAVVVLGRAVDARTAWWASCTCAGGFCSIECAGILYSLNELPRSPRLSRALPDRAYSYPWDFTSPRPRGWSGPLRLPCGASPLKTELEPIF